MYKALRFTNMALDKILPKRFFININIYYQLFILNLMKISVLFIH